MSESNKFEGIPEDVKREMLMLFETYSKNELINKLRSLRESTNVSPEKTGVNSEVTVQSNSSGDLQKQLTFSKSGDLKKHDDSASIISNTNQFSDINKSSVYETEPHQSLNSEKSHSMHDGVTKYDNIFECDLVKGNPSFNPVVLLQKIDLPKNHPICSSENVVGEISRLEDAPAKVIKTRKNKNKRTNLMLVNEPVANIEKNDDKNSKTRLVVDSNLEKNPDMVRVKNIPLKTIGQPKIRRTCSRLKKEKLQEFDHEISPNEPTPNPLKKINLRKKISKNNDKTSKILSKVASPIKSSNESSKKSDNENNIITNKSISQDKVELETKSNQSPRKKISKRNDKTSEIPSKEASPTNSPNQSSKKSDDKNIITNKSISQDEVELVTKSNQSPRKKIRKNNDKTSEIPSKVASPTKSPKNQSLKKSDHKNIITNKSKSQDEVELVTKSNQSPVKKGNLKILASNKATNLCDFTPSLKSQDLEIAKAVTPEKDFPQSDSEINSSLDLKEQLPSGVKSTNMFVTSKRQSKLKKPQQKEEKVDLVLNIDFQKQPLLLDNSDISSPILPSSTDDCSNVGKSIENVSTSSELNTNEGISVTKSRSPRKRLSRILPKKNLSYQKPKVLKKKALKSNTIEQNLLLNDMGAKMENQPVSSDDCIKTLDTDTIEQASISNSMNEDNACNNISLDSNNCKVLKSAVTLIESCSSDQAFVTSSTPLRKRITRSFSDGKNPCIYEETGVKKRKSSSPVANSKKEIQKVNLLTQKTLMLKRKSCDGEDERKQNAEAYYKLSKMCSQQGLNLNELFRRKEILEMMEKYKNNTEALVFIGTHKCSSSGKIEPIVHIHKSKKVLLETLAAIQNKNGGTLKVCKQ